jgi:biotin-(acetyl-CoA carboxylase) ligase
LGEAVTILQVNGSKQEGVMKGVDENGALLLQKEDGSTLTILAGEVSLRR